MITYRTVLAPTRHASNASGLVEECMATDGWEQDTEVQAILASCRAQLLALTQDRYQAARRLVRQQKGQHHA